MLPRWFKKPLSTALLCLAILSMMIPAIAQTTTGVVSGTATATGGAALPGATVTLSPGKHSTTSDEQGNFRFSGIAPGTYAVKVSYLGFNPYTASVSVGPKGTAAVQAVLQVAGTSQTVTVAASTQAVGMAQAINEQRSISNITDVLPRALIVSLPNANLADAVGRLPGVTLERDEGEGKYVQIRGTEPRLSNLTIDGVQVPSPEGGIRQVKLDTIPADLIESVDVYKTLEADQPGDAIGGSANLQTKMATNTPVVSFYTQRGYTPINHGVPVWNAGGTAGKRFGARQQFGIIGSGEFDYNGRGIYDVEPIPMLNPGNQVFFQTADLRNYRYQRKRYGFGIDSDYRFSDKSTVWVRSLFSDFKDQGRRYDYGIFDNTPANYGGAAPTDGSTTPTLTTEGRLGDYQVADLVLGGSHTTGAWEWDWKGAAARARMLNPINGGESITTFNYINSTSNCQYDPAATTTTYEPRFTPACYTEAFNPANFVLSSVGHANHGLTAQVNLQASTSFTRSYMAASDPGVLRGGLYFLSDHKFDDSWENDYTPNGQIPMTQFLDGFQTTNYYGGAYPYGPGVGWGKVNSYLTANPGQFAMTSTAGGNSNNFDLVEHVAAAYLMNTIAMGRFTLIGGLRVERTTDNSVAFFQQLDTSGNVVKQCLCGPAKSQYTNLLPSASLEMQLDSNSDIRFAYARGINRPDPQYLTAAVSVDASFDPTGNHPLVTVGNPALGPETANNYDVLYERYFQPVGEVRAGFFYKDLFNPIVSNQSGQPLPNVPDCPTASCYEVTSSNAGGAHIAGVELSFDQNFRYLPGFLSHFGMFGNWSYAASQAQGLAGRSDRPAMLRQAPYTWNLSPTLDWGRLSMRAGLSYNGANIYQYNYQDGNAGGITSPNGDIYLYQHIQVDAQASFAVGHGITLLVDGLNLNNAPFGFYQGSKQYPIQREFYHPTYSIGLRWSSGGE